MMGIRLQNISTKNKTLLLVLGSVLLFSTILLASIYNNQKKRLQDAQNEYYANIKDSYEKILEQHQSFYAYRLRNVINIRGVKEALETQNREALYEIVHPHFTMFQEENSYIKIMHFHLPNGESFLRVHNKEKFGDNIAQKRAMAATMHRLQKTLNGFEAGIYMLAYRAFLPIHHNERYIGAVEIGSRPDEILTQMDYYSHLRGALFVKENKIIEYAEKSAFQRGEYKLQYSTLANLALLQLLPKEYDFTSKLEITHKDKTYAIYPFDIHDYNQEISAKAVFFHDISQIKSKFQKSVQQLLVLLIALMGLLVLAIHIGFSKIIKTIEEINKRLKNTIDTLNTNRLFTDSILQNSAHSIIATDTKGVITLFNKRAQEMLHYTDQEVVGKETPELFHQKEQLQKRMQELTKELHITFDTPFEMLVAKTKLGMRNDDEWIYVAKDGREFPVALHITTLTDASGELSGYLGLAEDRTDMKIKEKQISQYVSLINKNIISSTTDLQGNITYVSEAFCEISGYTKEELLGKNHRIIRHPDTPQETFDAMWKKITNDEVWEGEIKNTTKSGGYYWAKNKIYPIYDTTGKKIGYTSIRQDITDKKIIEEISITDGLTQIYNRRHFNDVFPKIINGAKRNDELLCFLLMDIDHFKLYNDNYGHQAGDKVLIQFAASLKSSLKRARDMAFRLGGEEFGVIYKAQNFSNAYAFANQIRQNIQDLKITHDYNSASPYISASMGLVCYKASTIEDMDTIYKEADELLYKSKQSGRNRVSANTHQ